MLIIIHLLLLFIFIFIYVWLMVNTLNNQNQAQNPLESFFHHHHFKSFNEFSPLWIIIWWTSHFLFPHAQGNQSTHEMLTISALHSEYNDISCMTDWTSDQKKKSELLWSNIMKYTFISMGYIAFGNIKTWWWLPNSNERGRIRIFIRINKEWIK